MLTFFTLELKMGLKSFKTSTFLVVSKSEAQIVLILFLGFGQISASSRVLKFVLTEKGMYHNLDVVKSAAKQYISLYNECSNAT